MKWIRRGLGFLLLIVLAAAAAAAIYRHLALPVTEGRFAVSGLRAGLAIERDRHGIPTIRAASAEDAWFGLGFAHAQDRLWQLETHKRIGAGRLAELFGPGALEADKFLRALGVRRAAERQWDAASPAVRQMLEAYAAGINAFLADHLRARPPEFLLLELQPEEWSPIDSLAWSIMMAWDLGGNWSSELLRMRLALTMPVERIQQLLPPYPGDVPLATADYAALYRHLGVAVPRAVPARQGAPSGPVGALQRWLEGGIEGTGSNNWVVAGSRSVTGQPLLANDPHLKLSAPALWYFARLEAPGLKVAGATMPGLPLVVLGQNEHIAWGFTNTAPDVQDLYLERLDQRNDERYETPGGWARFESVRETIKVKGADDVVFVARRSRHGPILSDAGGATEGLTGAAGRGGAPRYAIALRWTALDADAFATLEAGLAFNRARSVDEFIEASAGYVAPMQNMVVADRERVAMVAAGRVPVRRPENDLEGLVPAPGWDARYDWIGFVPAGETPRERDPARGWIATANHRIHGPQYPHFITSEWTVPYRQQRIERLLDARPLHSLDSLAEIQADVLSAAALVLLPTLRKAQSSHALAEAVQRELATFDGTMGTERAAPLVFWAWVRQLTQGVFADDLGAALFERELGRRSFRQGLEGVLARDDAHWCNDRSTPQLESCAEQVDAAFTRALDELQARFGPELAAWRWGAAHVARAEHRPFSRFEPLARWFELRAPVGGDTYTVNAARVSLRPNAETGELYLNEHGPSLRALYDLGDRGKSRFMHSSGQSGLVFSRDYRAFLEPWARGDYLPLWGEERPAQVLRLVPR